MDKETQALKKLFELSRSKKNDEVLEKIVRGVGGQLGDIKFVLKRLFSKRYDGSIEAYRANIRTQLTNPPPKTSLDIITVINEHNRLLREFQEHGSDWYDELEQGGYL